MATKYSNQYQGAYVSKPMEQIKPGDISGDVKFAYFDITVDAVGSLNDVFKLFKLPKGAKLKAFRIITPDMGTAGDIQVGWAASADGVEAASADGILGTTDANAAAADTSMPATAAGFLKDFAAEVDVEMKVVEAWTATTGTIKGYAEYVVI